MAIDNFIPEIWSARLLTALEKALVYGGIVNRDYEGEIRAAGDTVRINSIGDPTIGTYTKNTNIGDPETLTDAQSTLSIDQSKYFNFAVDDIDKAQAKPGVMDEAMQRSGYKLRDTADQYIAALYTGVASGNTIGSDGTPKVPTKADAYEYLVDLGVLLDENDVPSDGRWVVVPPWFYGLLQKDDRFIDASKSGNAAALRNGQVGDAAGFTVHKSNNTPNTSGTKYKIMAGHPIAMTYAQQILGVEAFRPEKRFGDAVKGLHVYGAKLVRPSAIVLLTANKS